MTEMKRGVTEMSDLVTCAECKYSSIEGDDIEGTHYRWCSWIGHEVDEDSFCSWGEREGE